MRKMLMVAILAMATSGALMADPGVKKHKHKRKAKTECCDTTSQCSKTELPPKCSPKQCK